MRFRFSLRTLFAMTTLVALACAWGVLPSMTARQLVSTLSDEDLQTADQMFLNADDQFLQKWDNERWAFRVSGQLAPITIGQLIRGHRIVVLSTSYFAFDQTAGRAVRVAATTFGIKAPVVGPERFGLRFIDGVDGVDGFNFQR